MSRPVLRRSLVSATTAPTTSTAPAWTASGNFGTFTVFWAHWPMRRRMFELKNGKWQPKKLRRLNKRVLAAKRRAEIARHKRDPWSVVRLKKLLAMLGMAKEAAVKNAEYMPACRARDAGYVVKRKLDEA